MKMQYTDIALLAQKLKENIGIGKMIGRSVVEGDGD